MSVTDIATKKTPPPNEQFALEAAATTRLLEAEGILDYSGHVSIRIPGRDALVIQVGSTSRQEVGPANILVCDFDCNVHRGRRASRRARR